MNWLRLFFSLPNSTIARSGRRDRPCVCLLYIVVHLHIHRVAFTISVDSSAVQREFIVELGSRRFWVRSCLKQRRD